MTTRGTSTCDTIAQMRIEEPWKYCTAVSPFLEMNNRANKARNGIGYIRY